MSLSLWSHHWKLPVAAAQIPSDQTDLPLLLTDAVLPPELWTTARSDGGDIRLSSDEAGVNLLPHELLRYDAGTQKAEIWVKTPLLTAIGDTDLYVHFGKADATAPLATDPFGRNAVWSDYGAVLHLAEGSGPYIDSTGNGHDGTASGSASVTSTAHPWGGQWQDSSDNNFRIDLATTQDLLDNAVAGSVQIWAYSRTAESAGILSNRLNGINTNFFQLGRFSTGDWNFIIEDGSGEAKVQSPASLLQATSLAMIWDASGVTGMINGASIGNMAFSGDGLFTNNKLIQIGNYYNNALGFNGLFGAVRIARFRPSADRLLVEYRNQTDPATFFGTGSYAGGGGGESLTALSLSLPAASVGGAALQQDHGVTAGTVSSVGATGSAGIVQDHILGAAGVMAAAALGLPVLSTAGTASLTAGPIILPAAFLTTPALGQHHGFLAPEMTLQVGMMGLAILDGAIVTAPAARQQRVGAHAGGERVRPPKTTRRASP